MAIREISRVTPKEFSIVSVSGYGVVAEIKYIVGKGEDSSLERCTIYKSGHDSGWSHFGTGTRIREILERFADAQYFKITHEKRLSP